MLERVNFDKIIQQMIIQMALTFIARLEQEVSLSEELFSMSHALKLVEDFQSGFDRRLALMVMNHVILNLDKAMLDGTVFDKLLHVKNAGEWNRLMDEIEKDHFKLKNDVDYVVMVDKLFEFCRKLEEKFEQEDSDHEDLIEEFREIIHHKLNGKFKTLSSRILNTTSDVLYLCNRYPKDLLYFYPEVALDPLLRAHLEKMIGINKTHVESLTKDIKIEHVRSAKSVK